MNDRDAMIAALAAHPHEDTPRMALADLLDEQGAGEPAARIRWWNGAQRMLRTALAKPIHAYDLRHPQVHIPEWTRQLIGAYAMRGIPETALPPLTPAEQRHYAGGAHVAELHGYGLQSDLVALMPVRPMATMAHRLYHAGLTAALQGDSGRAVQAAARVTEESAHTLPAGTVPNVYRQAMLIHPLIALHIQHHFPPGTPHESWLTDTPHGREQLAKHYEEQGHTEAARTVREGETLAHNAFRALTAGRTVLPSGNRLTGSWHPERLTEQPIESRALPIGTHERWASETPSVHVPGAHTAGPVVQVVRAGPIHRAAQLARLKAPRGGSVSGGLFSRGGQFMGKAFRRISQVAPRLVRLARADTGYHVSFISSREPGWANAVGLWPGGAEPSRVIPAANAQANARNAEALSRRFGQHTALWFDSGPGADRAHVLQLTGSPKAIRSSLAKHGITNATITKTAVHIVDPGGQHTPQIAGWAREAGATGHQEYAGKATITPVRLAREETPGIFGEGHPLGAALMDRTPEGLRHIASFLKATGDRGHAIVQRAAEHEASGDSMRYWNHPEHSDLREKALAHYDSVTRGGVTLHKLKSKPKLGLLPTPQLLVSKRIGPRQFFTHAEPARLARSEQAGEDGWHVDPHERVRIAGGHTGVAYAHHERPQLINDEWRWRSHHAETFPTLQAAREAHPSASVHSTIFAQPLTLDEHEATDPEHTGAQLLRAAAHEPHEDTPWAAYADYAREQGDERAANRVHWWLGARKAMREASRPRVRGSAGFTQVANALPPWARRLWVADLHEQLGHTHAFGPRAVHAARLHAFGLLPDDRLDLVQAAVPQGAHYRAALAPTVGDQAAINTIAPGMMTRHMAASDKNAALLNHLSTHPLPTE